MAAHPRRVFEEKPRGHGKGRGERVLDQRVVQRVQARCGDSIWETYLCGEKTGVDLMTVVVRVPVTHLLSILRDIPASAGTAQATPTSIYLIGDVAAWRGKNIIDCDSNFPVKSIY